MVTFEIVQCHPGLNAIFYFWHLGTLALRADPECLVATYSSMAELKNNCIMLLNIYIFVISMLLILM